MEHLILECGTLSSEWYRNVEPARWCEILCSFSRVKSLLVDHGLVGEIPRSLQSDDGEFRTELLPELRELSDSASDDDETFTAFVNARQNAGHPVTLTRSRTYIVQFALTLIPTVAAYHVDHPHCCVPFVYILDSKAHVCVRFLPTRLTRVSPAGKRVMKSVMRL